MTLPEQPPYLDDTDPSELDIAGIMAMEYYRQHDRIAPEVSGYTIDELQEEALRKRDLACDPNVVPELAEVYGYEAGFMERLAGILRSL